MAAHGGGAWKVAYADFVTAMMAFFLVMWICGQDQKVRKAVSDYFGDPLALNQGVSTSPYRSGSLFETLRSGSVPQAEGVAMARGRSTHTMRGEHSRITKLVSDWLRTDDETWQYWREKVQRQRESLPPPKDGDPKKADTPFEIATMHLSQQLRDEITRDIPAQVKGLYGELLQDALAGVNWKQLAEDLLSDP